MDSDKLREEGEPIPHTKRLLVRIVDYMAVERPDVLYGEFPISPTTYEDGFRGITYSAFANAINGMAWWLHNTLGPGKNFETLAYIGPNDLRYPTLILGANKAGYKILLASPRNSVKAQWHLFKALDCRVMLTPNPQPPPVSAILNAPEYQLRVLEVPIVDDLLEKVYPVYHYNKSFEEAREDPFVALHTSGTTGLPKPIVWPQDYPSSLGKQVQMDPPAEYENNDRLYQGNRVFVFFPPFHAAYLAHTLVNAITNQTCMIFPLQAAIPSAQGLSDGLKKTRADAAFVVPLMVEQMSKDQALLDHISGHLDILVYAGGDLPQASGDIVTSKIKLINFYGATEIGSVAILRPEGAWIKEDWKYIIFHPDIGMDLRHFAGEMYELYILRQADVDHQPTFTIFSDIQEYRTRDLWAPHPVKANRWRHCGRADDIIVFLTGEKTNPVTMEQYISARSSEINVVLVAGSLRFQASLLIEPSSKDDMSPTEKAQFINRLWPLIEEANQDCPAHAKISKSHILFTNPKRPMLRTPKGTVQRQETMRAYVKELDDLYADAEEMATSDEPSGSFNPRDPSTVTDFLRKTILGISSLDLADDENMFVKGLDSLQALRLTRDLRRALAMKQVSVSMIYANPSISLLERAICQFVEQEVKSASVKEQIRQDAISETLTRYRSLLDRISQPKNKSENSRAQCGQRNVLLTGSTGSLGSYLLDILLAEPSVSHVFCLNRSLDSDIVQVKRSRLRGLTTKFSDRVTFLNADLSQSNLGLAIAKYETIRQSVTTVIHNAWPVNFNLSLSSFTPQLAGVTNLIDFTVSAPLQPTLFFISSISSVSSIPTLIPEEVIANNSAPSAMGYAESKYISESLLSHAAQILGIDARVARVGQIAGPVDIAGAWNREEWLPSLVISSLHLEVIPCSLPPGLNTVNWVPIDRLAKALVELALGEPDVGAQDESHPAGSGRGTGMFVHPHNLHPVSWESLLPTITSTLASVGHGKTIEAVPFRTWVRRVHEDLEGASSKRDLKDADLEKLHEANPAAKLLEFFREQIDAPERRGLETKAAERMSSHLRALGPVNSRWMDKWVRAWFG